MGLGRLKEGRFVRAHDAVKRVMSDAYRMNRAALNPNRSVQIFSGQRLWDVLTPAVARQPGITGAIAFVGEEADQVLPLVRGATIIVNAGDSAIRQGSTDPRVLLVWHRRGVKVHTLSGLHAKMLLVESTEPFVAVGSANASSNSAARLDEAVMVTDLPDAIVEARMAMTLWLARAGAPLTEAWLIEAVSRFSTDRTAASEPIGPDTGVRVAEGPVGLSDSPPHRLPWPRPRTIYLLPLLDTEVLPEEVIERADQLYEDLGLQRPAEGSLVGMGDFTIQTYFNVEEPDQDQPFSMQYPANSHVIAVDSPTWRTKKSAQVSPMGRILSIFLDERAHPRRRYFFVLTCWWSTDLVFGDVMAALAAVGEKATFDRAYMMEVKVNALLGLWPEALYDE